MGLGGRRDAGVRLTDGDRGAAAVTRRGWSRVCGLGSTVGFVGPFGAYITGFMLVVTSLALVSAFTVVSALSHDQGAYASLMSEAANSAVRDVDVQALAGGQTLVDSASAPTTFEDYLIAQGGLTQSSTGTYVPSATSSAQTAGETPTVTGLSLSQSVTSTDVVAQGWASAVIPLPVLGAMTVRLPVNVDVRGRAQPADRIP